MMNGSSHFFLQSFHVHNMRNRKLFENCGATDERPAGASAPSVVGDMVGVGLCDSFTGSGCSHFVSKCLARAISLHTRVPEEIARLKKRYPDDPLVNALAFGRTHNQFMRRPGKPSLVTPWDMEQYAHCADASFLQEANRCRDLGGGEADDGCRAVWFTAGVVPTESEAEKPNGTKKTALDICVSGVGTSRAFGLGRSAESSTLQGKPSVLHCSRRETVVPLSMDHHPLREEEYRRVIAAGGRVVSSEGNFIDGNPFYNVSRSFGHFRMKSNRQLSMSKQKLIATPTSMRWRMFPGDVLVLCNHAVFENRHTEDTSVNEVADLVGREVDRGLLPDEVAAAVCDFAVQFGSQHALQVTVAVAKDWRPDVMECGALCTPRFEESVRPGPIYAHMCQRHHTYAERLLRDCERCHISLPELLLRRWELIREVLPQRHALPLSTYYGKECGVVRQCMEEEAELFSHELLRRDPPLSRQETISVFSAIAKELVSKK